MCRTRLKYFLSVYVEIQVKLFCLLLIQSPPSFSHQHHHHEKDRVKKERENAFRSFLILSHKYQILQYDIRYFSIISDTSVILKRGNGERMIERKTFSLNY